MLLRENQREPPNNTLLKDFLECFGELEPTPGEALWVTKCWAKEISEKAEGWRWSESGMHSLPAPPGWLEQKARALRKPFVRAVKREAVPDL